MDIAACGWHDESKSICESVRLEQCPFRCSTPSAHPCSGYDLFLLYHRSSSILTPQTLVTSSFAPLLVSKFLSYRVLLLELEPTFDTVVLLLTCWCRLSSIFYEDSVLYLLLNRSFGSHLCHNSDPQKDLLHVPIYAGVQIFIQSSTLTTLCHIKRDHRHMLKMSTINNNNNNNTLIYIAPACRMTSAETYAGWSVVPANIS